MSKGLRNMERMERVNAIQRRIKNATFGLGYWGAIAALPKEAERIAVEKRQQEEARRIQ